MVYLCLEIFVDPKRSLNKSNDSDGNPPAKRTSSMRRAKRIGSCSRSQRLGIFCSIFGWFSDDLGVGFFAIHKAQRTGFQRSFFLSLHKVDTTLYVPIRTIGIGSYISPFFCQYPIRIMIQLFRAPQAMNPIKKCSTSLLPGAYFLPELSSCKSWYGTYAPTYICIQCVISSQLRPVGFLKHETVLKKQVTTVKWHSHCFFPPVGNPSKKKNNTQAGYC